MAKKETGPQEASKPSLLPTKRNIPKKSLITGNILIYGPPKIGKSTLASQFPSPLFLATEEGLDWIPAFKTSISDWDQFGEVCAEINEAIQKGPLTIDKTPIRVIVIDVIDLLYKMCSDYICTSMGISHPADLEWGKGWSSIGDEWQRVICKICRWPFCTIFISHSKEVERKGKGQKITATAPSMSGQGFKTIHALCDMILYCYMDEVAIYGEEDPDTPIGIEEQRVIRCQPQNNLIAGDRSGLLPAQIPLSYEALVSYFPETETG